MMRPLTKIIVVGVAGALICLLMVWFAIWPVLDSLTVVNNKLQQDQIELATLEQQNLAFQRAQADLNRATRKNEITNAIGPKEGLVTAVNDLEAAASKSGTTQALQLLERDPKAKPADVIGNKHGIDEVQYQTTTNNDYIGTINFLALLENMPHFTEIAKISLSSEIASGSSKDKTLWTGRVLGTINGVFFVKTVQP
jgi:hypothetical protein